jgi:hypothetical protein
MGVDLSVPSYSDICKRALTVKINLGKYNQPINGKGINICLDSTGLKVSGEGEWKVRKHGWNRHRTWQKLHLAINPNDGEILSCDLTTNSITDAQVVPKLLAPIECTIEKLIADGAYDKWGVYNILEDRKILAVIPPQKNSKICLHGNASGRKNLRDQNIRLIRKIGRRKWKEKTGYHIRSLAETAMFRYKTIIGEKLKSKILLSQLNEATIGCKILNKLINLGTPQYSVAH